jgi:pyruvate dehydrogenase E1 component alpha subunit
VPRALQTASATFAQKAIAYGMHGVLVDGNDVLALINATAQAPSGARARRGPHPDRGPHLPPRRPQLVRLSRRPIRDPERARCEWEHHDPKPRFRRYLEQRQLWSA